MAMAIEFYDRYFPEMPIRGFWSSSWLYDTRLSLVLDNEKSNIVHVQRQFYNYPTDEGTACCVMKCLGTARLIRR